jgi:hypothetical protein
MGKTKGYWLTFGGKSTILVEGYSDAVWAGQTLDFGIFFPIWRWARDDCMELQKATHYCIVEHRS